MRHAYYLRLTLFLLTAASTWGADAYRGMQVLENQGCLECHTVRRQGIGHEAIQPAPDLGGRLAAKYTAAALASTLWNHTPAMWAELSAKDLAIPAATESDWQDLFAYLYSLELFDLPAELRRGRQVLQEKRCTECHSVPNATSPASPTGKPAVAWSVGDPVQLAFEMWNHGRAMRESAKGSWKTLSGRDLLDLTAYVQNLQKTVPNREFSLPEPATGKPLFEQNCARCHRGPASLSTLLRNTTWMDIAAAMWNHVPNMPATPFVSAGDMRKILAYTWELQYMGPPGSIMRGQRTFEQRKCGVCHSDATTKPSLSPRPGQIFTPFSMVALGWGHGRKMHQEMIGKGVRWPRLTSTEVSNLVAYLNSLSLDGSTRVQ